MMCLSEQIELVICVLEKCKSDAQWFEEQFKLEERRENDIRHEMEGVANDKKRPPKYKERAVLATQWQETLIARRVAKDNIALIQPLLSFVNSDTGKNAINQLKQKLGEVKKLENRMQNRQYAKRVPDSLQQNAETKKKLNKLIRDWKKDSKSRY